MDISNISKMSLEELEKYNQKLNAERDGIIAEQRQAMVKINKLKAEEAAAKKVANMSKTEKQAMAQAIEAEGIESAEEFGNPGV